MLLVEWEYIRLYINSLAVQAVAERESSQGVGIDGQSVRVSDEEAIYIEHVVDASKSILNYTIYEFAPRGYLRLSPVKVFLRIISAAVFLVKVPPSSHVTNSRHLLLDVVQQISTLRFHYLTPLSISSARLRLMIYILRTDFQCCWNLCLNIFVHDFFLARQCPICQEPMIS